ncbi:MAG: regulatory protein RecX [Candidatus Alectryocaccobium sp.]|jgi:regulatory protein|nr:recombination regulator RecX [Lachnospiraceae bacterium]MDY6220845.1 regulatory protein RecX [Candidatus Alectryocaccobium sp.]
MSTRYQKSAVEKAMDLLLFKARSEYELRSKLKEKEYPDGEIDEAVKYVRSFGYLNDRKYAEQFVLSNSSKKSISSIRYELKQKHIADEIIEEVLLDVETDEEDIVYELILKKAGEPPHVPDEKEERRLFGFCARRGFSTATIFKALNRYKDGAEEYKN